MVESRPRPPLQVGGRDAGAPTARGLQTAQLNDFLAQAGAFTNAGQKIPEFLRVAIDSLSKSTGRTSPIGTIGLPSEINKPTVIEVTLVLDSEVLDTRTIKVVTDTKNAGGFADFEGI